MLQALSFLTIIGRVGTPRPGSLPYFPVAGALIGLAVGYSWWGAQHLWPPLVAAGIALAVDAVLTGLLHLDGLSDSADGLIAPMEREQRLTVMRDPAVGAFGAVALIVVLLLRFSVFASVPATPLTVAALWCLARAAMALVALVVPYARTAGGLASAFLGAVSDGPATAPDGRAGNAAATPRRSTLIGAAAVLAAGIAIPLAAVELGWWSAAILGAGLLGAALMTVFARARIGGFTGDTLGATGVLAETFGLLALAAAVSP